MSRTTPGALLLALSVLFCGIGCQPTSNIGAAPSSEVTKGTGSTPVAPTPGSEPAASTATPGTSPTTPSPAAGSETKPLTAPAPTGETTKAGGGPGAGDAVSLRFAMAKGSEYKFLNSTSASQEAGGGSKPATPPKPLETVSNTVVKVTDVSGGKAKVEMTVSKMQISGGAADAKTKEALNKASKDSEGVKVAASFDQFGKPSDISYIKGTREQAMLAGIDSNTGFFGISYPENAVKVGDSWSHTYDFKDLIGAMGSMPGANWKDSSVKTEFTLKSVDTAAGIAVLTITSAGSPSVTIKMPSGGATKTSKPEAPKEVSLNFSVAGSGTATIELKTGVPKLVEYAMTTEFKTPMGAGKQSVKASLKRSN
ncbi:MAG: hypothetical protein JSS66_01085 [Armatimonadetes bacterium]|nr:hypothetical protein [Armatimonadota bacterium]